MNDQEEQSQEDLQYIKEDSHSFRNFPYEQDNNLEEDTSQYNGS